MKSLMLVISVLAITLSVMARTQDASKQSDNQAKQNDQAARVRRIKAMQNPTRLCRAKSAATVRRS